MVPEESIFRKLKGSQSGCLRIGLGFNREFGAEVSLCSETSGLSSFNRFSRPCVEPKSADHTTGISEIYDVGLSNTRFRLQAVVVSESHVSQVDYDVVYAVQPPGKWDFGDGQGQGLLVPCPLHSWMVPWGLLHSLSFCWRAKATGIMEGLAPDRRISGCRSKGSYSGFCVVCT